MIGFEKEEEGGGEEEEISYEPVDTLPSIQVKFAYEKHVRNKTNKEEMKNPHLNLDDDNDDDIRVETNDTRLASRQKQIDYGKNTIGYERYLAILPKNKRKRGDPWTPDKLQMCSKRSWDGQIKKWRRLLHKYDPEE